MSDYRIVWRTSPRCQHGVRPPEPDVVGYPRLHRDRGQHALHLRAYLLLSPAELRDLAAGAHPAPWSHRRHGTGRAHGAEQHSHAVGGPRRAAVDLRSVQIGMVVCTALALTMCVLRGFEFRDLHVRWDSGAYGTWPGRPSLPTRRCCCWRPWSRSSSRCCSSVPTWSSGTWPGRATTRCTGISSPFPGSPLYVVVYLSPYLM